MKRTACLIALTAGIFFTNTMMAQEKDTQDSTKKKHHHAITISNKGIRVDATDSSKTQAGKIKSEESNKSFTGSFALLDLGVNMIQDNTNYNDPAVKTFLSVPANRQNTHLFDQRNNKSINVNIYPWMVKFKALKTHGQRIYISTGIGLQLYNFRYENPLTFTKNPSSVTLDTISFKKDKLAIDYLNVPLMFTFKTRLFKEHWLTYGVGVTEGYRIDSWNKQVSDQRGKTKVHGTFGLDDFNTCVSAEFGIEGVFRFYASYQVTSLYTTGLDQHPISFGLRFSGI